MNSTKGATHKSKFIKDRFKRWRIFDDLGLVRELEDKLSAGPKPLIP